MVLGSSCTQTFPRSLKNTGPELPASEVPFQFIPRHWTFQNSQLRHNSSIDATMPQDLCKKKKLNQQFQPVCCDTVDYIWKELASVPSLVAMTKYLIKNK